MARLRPFLLRATYDWVVEHDFTPYILIDAEAEGAEIPWEYVENGKIVLNVSPVAVRNFYIDNQYVTFEASFSGLVKQIYVPIGGLLALYARETGQGVYAREEGIGMLVNEGDKPEQLDPNPRR